jgi:hypothetical protein
MNRIILLAAGLLTFGIASILPLVGPAVAEEATPADRPAAISPQDGPVRLFNGKDLAGNYTWLKDSKRDDPRRVFRVTDGLLHVTGDGWGGIITRERYRDYHLIVEFKWGERTWQDREHAARDSGILIHSNGVDGGYQGIWMPAIEVQIIEGGVGDFILVTGDDESGQPVPIALTTAVRKEADGETVWDAKGMSETFNASNRRRVNWFGRDPDWEDRLGFRGKQDVESPHGQWTRVDVMADRDRIEVYVNGVKVNEAFEASPRAGRIQLQSELAEIFFRRWELWPIGKGPKPSPAEQ